MEPRTRIRSIKGGFMYVFEVKLPRLQVFEIPDLVPPCHRVPSVHRQHCGVILTDV